MILLVVIAYGKGVVSYYWYVRCRSPVGLRCHLFTFLDPVPTMYHYESPFQLGVADGVIWIYYWDLSFVWLVCDRIVVLFMGSNVVLDSRL